MRAWKQKPFKVVIAGSSGFASRRAVRKVTVRRDAAQPPLRQVRTPRSTLWRKFLGGVTRGFWRIAAFFYALVMICLLFLSYVYLWFAPMLAVTVGVSYAFVVLVLKNTVQLQALVYGFGVLTVLASLSGGASRLTLTEIKNPQACFSKAGKAFLHSAILTLLATVMVYIEVNGGSNLSSTGERPGPAIFNFDLGVVSEWLQQALTWWVRSGLYLFSNGWWNFALFILMGLAASRAIQGIIILLRLLHFGELQVRDLDGRRMWRMFTFRGIREDTRSRPVIQDEDKGSGFIRLSR